MGFPNWSGLCHIWDAKPDKGDIGLYIRLVISQSISLSQGGSRLYTRANR